jgi:succinoglycan biosynthesis transport protein ExoP
VTIQDNVRILREQWLVLVLAVLVGLGAAAAAFYARPPEYTAHLTMYVSSQSSSDSPTSAYVGAQLSEARVTSYVELVSSDRVAGDVARELGLGIPAAELAERIVATSQLDSVLIDVAVQDASPQAAATVANTVGDVFTALVDELERPVDPDVAQAVAVRVVQPAAVPDEPSTMSLPLVLVLGAVLGLAAGVAAALARNALDTSVKSVEVLRAAADAANLGTIAYDAQVPRRPLTLHGDPQSPRAEAFRQLRTNLQFVDVDHPRKVIVVTSAMPAEGKTTTTANLAIALAAAGSRVLLVEGDLRRPKVADLLGLERTVGLTSVLSGRLPVDEAIQAWGSGQLHVLASGPLPPNPSELLASRQMTALVDELRRAYDVVLIDSPPLLPVTDAAAVAPATDGVLLVCRFRQTTKSQVEAAAAALRAVSAPLLGTVFTMVATRGPRSYQQYTSYYRADQPVAPPNLFETLQPAASRSAPARRRTATGDRR